MTARTEPYPRRWAALIVLAFSLLVISDSAVAALPADAATAASDSVGAAHEVAAQVGSDLVSAANQAFVDAMSTTTSIAAGIAIAGALIATAFLPARAKARAGHALSPALETGVR
jgi:hypothetical protein